MGIPQLNFDRIQVVDPTQGALDAVNSAKSSLNDILRQGLAEEEVAQNKLVQDRDYAMRVKADDRLALEHDQKQSAYNAEKAFNTVYAQGPQNLMVSADGEYTDKFLAEGGSDAVAKRLGITAPAAGTEYSPEDKAKLDTYYGDLSKSFDKSYDTLGRESELQLVSRAAEAAGGEGVYSPQIAEKFKAARAAEAALMDMKRTTLKASILSKAKDMETARKDAVTEAVGKIYLMGDKSYSSNTTTRVGTGTGSSKDENKDKKGSGWGDEIKDFTIKQIVDEVGLPGFDEAKAKAVVQKGVDSGLSYKQIHAVLGQAVDLGWTGDTIDDNLAGKLIDGIAAKKSSGADGGDDLERSTSNSSTTSGSSKNYNYIGNPQLAKYHSELYGRLSKEKQALDAELAAIPTNTKSAKEMLGESASKWAKGGVVASAIPATVPVETAKPVVKSAPEARKVAPVKSAVQKNVIAPKGGLKAPPPLLVVPKQVAPTAPKVVKKPVYDPKNPEAYVKAANLLLAQKEALKAVDAKKRDDALLAKIRADNALKRKNTELRLLRAKMDAS
jgi:hypothetical protein